MSGKLYLCATPIGNLEDITLRVLRVLKEVDLIAAEDTRNSIKLLNHFDIKKPLLSYHEHSASHVSENIISRLQSGESCAVVTDAGMPCISDPGEDLVPFGGEGSKALQERMVDTLTNIMGSEGIETLLAVSHGSASRQFIKAAALEGFELPAKLPNCAIMIFDFEEAKPQAEGESMQCKFTLQQIVDPQQSH